MGLKDRFKDGRDWVEAHLTLDDIKSEMSVFETIIRFVGGLLTCYAFTNDEVFLRRSVEIADKMLPAFDTPTGLPHSLIKPATGASKNYAWASQSNSILAEVGTLYLEFAYLTAITGNKKYLEKVEQIRQLLDSLDKPHDGLYPNYINPKTGKFGQRKLHFMFSMSKYTRAYTAVYTYRLYYSILYILIIILVYCRLLQYCSRA